MKGLTVLCTFLFSFFISKGQDSPEAVVDSSLRATPRVEGMGKVKFLLLTYEYVSPFTISSASRAKGVSDASTTVKKLEEIGGKIYIPILLKPRTNLIMGIKYFYEEYTFSDSTIYPFYRNLHDKHLNSLVTNLSFSRSLNKSRFLVLRTGLELNGDYSNEELPLTRFLKTSLMGLFGWKKSPRLSYGFGFSYNYDLGGPSLYPAFLYNRTFNNSWGIESLFPANFKLRHNASPKSIFYLGYEVSGASYQLAIKDPPLSSYPTLELRKSRARLQMTWDHELLSFLWFTVSGGYNFNVNFNLAEQNDFGQKVLLKNDIGHSPFIQAGIFLTPPDNLRDKVKK